MSAVAALLALVAATEGVAAHAPPPSAPSPRLSVALSLGHREAPLGHAGVTLNVRALRYLVVVGGLGYVLGERGEYGRRGYTAFLVGLRVPFVIANRFELSLGTGLSRHDAEHRETSDVPGLGVTATHDWGYRGSARADFDLGVAYLASWGFIRLAGGLGVVVSGPSSCRVMAGEVLTNCAQVPSPSYLREPGLVSQTYVNASLGFNLF